MTRASRIPLAVACPPSLQEPHLSIAGDDSGARAGNCVHSIVPALCRGEPVDAAVAAAYWGVPVDEARLLTALAAQAWQKVDEFFPEPQFEVAFDDYEFSGHIDILSIVDPRRPRILDWKSGRLDFDARHQMMTYAWLVLGSLDVAELPAVEAVEIFVVRLRDQVCDHWAVTPAELEQWRKFVRERLADPTFRPGPHCGHCPRALECPARTLHLQNSMQLMPLAGTAHFWEQVVPQGEYRPVAVTLLLERARQVQEWAEAVEDFCRADVVANGGKLGRLEITEEKRQKIDWFRGKEIIEQFATNAEEFAVTVSKTKLLELVRDGAPDRGKGKAVRDLLDRLAQAGALTETTIEKLVIRHEPTTTTSISIEPAAIEGG